MRCTCRLYLRIILSLYLTVSVVVLHSSAAVVKLHGTATGFNNESFEVYCYADYISELHNKLALVATNGSGQFSCKLDIVSTTQVFIDWGVERGTLFLEPGKDYEIVLPQMSPKTTEQELNPFFQPDEFYIGISNADITDLNYLIRELDEWVNSFLERNFYTIYSGRKDILKKAIVVQRERYSAITNAYFVSFMDFKLKELENMAACRDRFAAIKYYFADSPIQYNNAAYMYFLRNTSEDMLLHCINKDQEGNIAKQLTNKSGLGLLKAVEPYIYGNDNLRTIVLLKGINDAFYSDKFDKMELIAVLEQLLSGNLKPELKTMATALHKKFTNLLVGTYAPNFNLLDLFGEQRTNTDFYGKFLYLNFCRLSSYSCRKDFEILQRLHERYSQYMTIVTVMLDDSPQDIETYVSEHGYGWTFLYDNKSKELEDAYMVASYPAYYLIDADGKLAVSPAPLPTDRFDAFIVQTLKQDSIKRLRQKAAMKK